jgi:hypothetical protein
MFEIRWIFRNFSKLVNSFQERIQLLFRIGGQTIQHYIQSSIGMLNQRAIGPHFQPPPDLWNINQNFELLQLHQSLGNKWKKLHSIFH